jgi:hypothetical protein
MSTGPPQKKQKVSDEDTPLTELPNATDLPGVSLLVLPDVLLRIVIDYAGVSRSAALSCVCKVLNSNVAIADKMRKTFRYTDCPTRSKVLVSRAKSNLVCLDLSNCVDWKDADCKELANKLPSLQHLDLSGALEISSHGAKNLARNGGLLSFSCNITKRFSLCKNMRLTAAYVKVLPKFAPKLRQVELTAGSKIKDGNLDVLGELPNLEALSLFLEGFNVLSMKRILSSSRTLTHLR